MSLPFGLMIRLLLSTFPPILGGFWEQDRASSLSGSDACVFTVNVYIYHSTSCSVYLHMCLFALINYSLH